MSRPLRWRPVLGGFLVLAAATFLGLTIARHSRQLEAFDWEVRWVWLAASILALAGVLALGVVVWKMVLDRFEHPAIPLRLLMRIWFLSNLARYVPGKIWQFVGAAELARAAGLARVVIVTSMLVHIGFSLLSAAVVAAFVLLPTGVPDTVSAGGLAALAVFSLILVHPAVLNAALGVVAKVLRRDVLRWRGRWGDGLLLLGISVLTWLAYGAAFGLFVHSMVRVDAAALVPLAGVNALSFLVGYLVFLAPAGLGAREGAMAVLLRPYAPVAVAAVVAVLSRLWTVAAELLGAGIVLALTGGMRPPGPDAVSPAAAASGPPDRRE